MKISCTDLNRLTELDHESVRAEQRGLMHFELPLRGVGLHGEVDEAVLVDVGGGELNGLGGCQLRIRAVVQAGGQAEWWQLSKVGGVGAGRVDGVVPPAHHTH